MRVIWRHFIATASGERVEKRLSQEIVKPRDNMHRYHKAPLTSVQIKNNYIIFLANYPLSVNILEIFRNYITQRKIIRSPYRGLFGDLSIYLYIKKKLA
jgi:hypothetical protein